MKTIQLVVSPITEFITLSIEAGSCRVRKQLPYRDPFQLKIHPTGHPRCSAGCMVLARPFHREVFKIAILCALQLEYDAVTHVFDEFYDEDGEPYGRAEGDINSYTTGRIGKHHVVLVLLPHMGKANASSAAASLGLQRFKPRVYDYPGADKDKLYEPNYRHKHHFAECDRFFEQICFLGTEKPPPKPFPRSPRPMPPPKLPDDDEISQYTRVRVIDTRVRTQGFDKDFHIQRALGGEALPGNPRTLSVRDLEHPESLVSHIIATLGFPEADRDAILKDSDPQPQAIKFSLETVQRRHRANKFGRKNNIKAKDRKVGQVNKSSTDSSLADTANEWRAFLCGTRSQPEVSEAVDSLEPSCTSQISLASYDDDMRKAVSNAENYIEQTREASKLPGWKEDFDEDLSIRYNNSIPKTALGKWLEGRNEAEITESHP